MQINVLGCSPIVQDTYCHNGSGYLVDRNILFDCGPGIWRALCLNSVSPANLNHICLSHFHIDHTSDLPAVLLARYLTNQQAQTLYLFGPPGLSEWFDKLMAVCGDWIKNMDIKLIELIKQQQIGVYTLNQCRTRHTENSICFRITDPHLRSIFYSGDTDYDEDILPCMKDADLAIMECSNLAASKVDGHLTPELAARLATHANVKHLVLTHMYPEVSNTDVRSLIANHYTGTVTVARDGLIMDI